MSTVSETLNTAADLLQERGWVGRGDGWDWHGSGGPVCLEGAIYAALGRPAHWLGGGWTSKEINDCPAGEAVRRHIETADALWHFNDTRRTAAEVIEVLRAAAVIEEARENESAAVEAHR